MKIGFIARKDRGIQAIKLADIIQSPKILKDHELIDQTKEVRSSYSSFRFREQQDVIAKDLMKQNLKRYGNSLYAGTTFKSFITGDDIT